MGAGRRSRNPAGGSQPCRDRTRTPQMGAAAPALASPPLSQSSQRIHYGSGNELDVLFGVELAPRQHDDALETSLSSGILDRVVDDPRPVVPLAAGVWTATRAIGLSVD